MSTSRGLPILLLVILEIGRCCSACSCYCFVVRIIFGNALDTSAGRKAGNMEGSVRELDILRLWVVGVLSFFCWCWSTQKGKGDDSERKWMCDDPWKDRRMTCNLYTLLSLPLVECYGQTNRRVRPTSHSPLNRALAIVFCCRRRCPEDLVLR